MFIKSTDTTKNVKRRINKFMILSKLVKIDMKKNVQNLKTMGIRSLITTINSKVPDPIFSLIHGDIKERR